MGQAATVFVSGGITGVLVSQLLGGVLAGRGGPVTLLLGILSYPMAALIFGVVISVVQLLIRIGFGVTYRAVQDGFAPFHSGAGLVAGAMFWPLVLVLVPFAI